MPLQAQTTVVGILWGLDSKQNLFHIHNQLGAHEQPCSLINTTLMHPKHWSHVTWFVTITVSWRHRTHWSLMSLVREHREALSPVPGTPPLRSQSLKRLYSRGVYSKLLEKWNSNSSLLQTNLKSRHMNEKFSKSECKNIYAWI